MIPAADEGIFRRHAGATPLMSPVQNHGCFSGFRAISIKRMIAEAPFRSVKMGQFIDRTEEN